MNALKAARILSGLTYVEVVEAAHISRQMLSMIENRHYKPSSKHLAALIELYGLPELPWEALVRPLNTSEMRDWFNGYLRSVA